jgi:hypothetical protein
MNATQVGWLASGQEKTAHWTVGCRVAKKPDACALSTGFVQRYLVTTAPGHTHRGEECQLRGV